MEKLDHNNREVECSDLARRLTRYRRRVEAEGRKRSLRVIDRALDDAGAPTKPDR